MSDISDKIERRIGFDDVVAVVSDVDTQAAKSITTAKSRLLDVVNTRLPDDYDDVWLWCDGERLLVTDHEDPMASEMRHLNHYEPGVHRAEAARMPGYAERSLVGREPLTRGLAELSAGELCVHVQDDYPVVVDGPGLSVAVAPKVKPEHAESSA
jgi:hypothetical protein